MAKCNLHAHSDVDLMIVGSVGFADVVLALAPAQDALRREINPSVLGRHEFIKRRDQQDSFVAAIWKEPKLWLLGTADELGLFGQGPTTRAASGAAGRSAALAGRCQTHSGGSNAAGNKRPDAHRLRPKPKHAE